MANVPPIYVGDMPVIERTIKDQDGNVLDVSSTSTKELKIRKPDRTTITTTVWVFKTDGVNGVVKYEVISSDFDASGWYLFQWNTNVGGKERKYQEEIEVEAQI